MEAERVTEQWPYLEGIQALCDLVARNPSVERLRVGDVEIVFRSVAPAARAVETRPPIPPEQVKKEARRRQYEVELGHPVSDALLARLP